MELLEEKYLISIIVPVYNVEKYLTECVDSIVNQSYKNLEIILVDDGSTDNSGYMCDQFARKDLRIRVFHKVNGGVSDARNYGLKVAKGDYIGFVDSDDSIELDMYENLLKLCIENEVKLSCSKFEEKCDKKIDKRGIRSEIKEVLLSAEELLKCIIWGDDTVVLTVAVWNRLYHRDIIKGVEFPKGKDYGEELVFTTKVVLNAGQCAYTSKELYHYRIRKDSIIHSYYGYNYNPRIISDLLTLQVEQIELLYTYEKKELARIARVKYYQGLLRIYSINRYKEYDELIRKTLHEWKPNTFEIIRLSIGWKEKIIIISKIFLPFIWKKYYKYQCIS